MFHPNFKIIAIFNLPYILTTAILYWHFGVRDVAKFKWWSSAVVNTIFVVKIMLYFVGTAIDCKLNTLSFKQVLLKEIQQSWQA